MKTKYTSQTARKPSWKSAILLAITALALCALPGVALAADCLPVTNWTDGKSSWFTSGNWSGGVPNSGTGAVVNNKGTAQISGSLPAANACSLTLGATAGQYSGNVEVSSEGSLTVTYGIVVGGDQGTGSLSVTSEGTVTSGDGIDVGGNASSGTSATGLLTVTDSATVTAASVHVYPSGTLTGNSTVSTPNGGITTVEGTLAPNWTLTINGNLTFVGITGPLMQCNVTPANLGNVDAEVTDTATLTGRLSVTMTGTFTCGTTYTLLKADVGVSGTFSSVSINFPSGQNFTPQIRYDATHVYLDLTCNTD